MEYAISEMGRDDRQAYDPFFSRKVLPFGLTNHHVLLLRPLWMHILIKRISRDSDVNLKALADTFRFISRASAAGRARTGERD